MKILVTGFEPFGGEHINPAIEAIKKLPNKIGSVNIAKVEIPTVFNRSIAQLTAAIKLENPDIVICIGQAGGRSELSLEKVAINLNESQIPDNAGQLFCGTPVVEGGDTAYFSTLPLKAILKELQDNGVPAKISYSAGTYVCNHLMYGLLHLAATEFPRLKGGFIHVPFLPEQVADKKDKPSMPLAKLVRGLEIILDVASRVDVDIESPAGETH